MRIRLARKIVKEKNRNRYPWGKIIHAFKMLGGVVYTWRIGVAVKSEAP